MECLTPRPLSRLHILCLEPSKTVTKHLLYTHKTLCGRGCWENPALQEFRNSVSGLSDGVGSPVWRCLELGSPAVTLLSPPTGQISSSCSLQRRACFYKGPDRLGFGAVESVSYVLYSADVARAGVDRVSMNGHGCVLIKLYLQTPFVDTVLQLLMG